MTALAPERVLFPRGLCFSVVGGGGGGWVVLTAANRHCSSKARRGGCLGLGVPLSQAHSHLKEALGQEAGRQGYSLETGRTSGALEGRLESAHTEGQEAFISVCPLAGPVPHCEGHLQGLLWARAPDPHSLHSAPSRPSALRRPQQGRSEGMGSQW